MLPLASGVPRKENLVKQPSARAPYIVPARHRNSGGTGSVQSPTVAVHVQFMLAGTGETLAVQFMPRMSLCVLGV